MSSRAAARSEVTNEGQSAGCVGTTAEADRRPFLMELELVRRQVQRREVARVRGRDVASEAEDAGADSAGRADRLRSRRDLFVPVLATVVPTRDEPVRERTVGA